MSILKYIKLPKKLNKKQIEDFFKKKDLSEFVRNQRHLKKKVNEMRVSGSYPPELRDLYRLYQFVILNKSFSSSNEMASELIDFVKSNLAEYKYPRWIEFLNELPKTATGKIQRFKLRKAG